MNKNLSVPMQKEFLFLKAQMKLVIETSKVKKQVEITRKDLRIVYKNRHKDTGGTDSI